MKVTRLSVTPIKALALHHPSSIDITATGVPGDREFYLVDDRDLLLAIVKTGALLTLSAEYDAATGRLVIRERGTVLCDAVAEPAEPVSANFFDYRTVTGRHVPGPWDALLSERVGRTVRLVRADEPNGGRDVEPLTILGDSSTAELARTAGLDSVDARRFRMLIEFDGAEPHAEDGWEGRRLRIGSAVVEVGGPVQRCAGTTRNPDSGVIDLKTLALIGDYRGRQDSIFGMGFNFGMYASTVEPGRISVGDEVTLIEEVGHMTFHTMDDMTSNDFEVLKRVHEENLANLPDLLLGFLDSLGGDEAYPVDRRTHSLQAATRALRDGRDEEYVVMALLHDIGEAMGPLNHGEVIAAILHPFLSEANHWTLLHHPLFQTYFYGSRVGIDPNGRDAYRDSPYFDRTAEFCAQYDEVSFDPDYPSEPLETFVPMVHRVLGRSWAPPTPATS